MRQVRDRRPPHRRLGIQVAQHGERKVGIELEHRNLALTGPHHDGDCVEFLPHQLW